MQVKAKGGGPLNPNHKNKTESRASVSERKIEELCCVIDPHLGQFKFTVVGM